MGIRERFLEKIQVSGSCVVWTGGTNQDGYGRMKIFEDADTGKQIFK
jgi:hypothetical protein